MINKACFVLIVAMSSAPLFAGETMVTQTTTVRQSTRCDFRVDKCETSVATDPSYVHFKDFAVGSPVGTRAGGGDPSAYQDNSAFTFVDYAPQPKTVDELVALIRSKLSNCPEITVNYDDGTGNITVHYLNSTCDCNCDWVVNVRNVKTDDFVWKRTSDNYSQYLGQMERRKFHCTSKDDAQEVESACLQICKINNWSTFN